MKERIYAFGWDAFNQLSLSEQQEKSTTRPVEISLSKDSQREKILVATDVVATSWCSTIFKCSQIEHEDGDIYTNSDKTEEGKRSTSILKFRGFPFSTLGEFQLPPLAAELEKYKIQSSWKFFGRDSLSGYLARGNVRLLPTREDEEASAETAAATLASDLAPESEPIWRDAVQDGQGRVLALVGEWKKGDVRRSNGAFEHHPHFFPLLSSHSQESASRNTVYLFSSAQELASSTKPGLQSSQLVQGLESTSVRSLSAGASHFLIHTSTSNLNGNQIYSLGDGRYGQLGTSTSVSSTDSHRRAQPISVFDRLNEGFPSEIDKVVAGGRHSVALTTDGSAYVWGWNGEGQLGLEPYSDVRGSSKHEEAQAIVWLPQLIQVMDGDLDIVDVSCGTSTTAIVTQDSRLWVSGSSESFSPLFSKLGTFCT